MNVVLLRTPSLANVAYAFAMSKPDGDPVPRTNVRSGDSRLRPGVVSGMPAASAASATLRTPISEVSST